MIKEMSYFVRRGPPLVVTGHQKVRRKLIVLREKKKGREARWKDKEEDRQVNVGATDILLTVCHKDNSSKRNYYRLVFT